jgi:transcriptional regulator with XRE-family HTH domain
MDANGHEQTASEASPFHGVLPPNRKIAKERADHRLAAYLFTVGLSQTEIAKRLGKTIATVSQWWRQPFMQEFIKEEMANGSRDTLSEIIKGAATDSVFTLITLRDGTTTPAAVKRQCCSELLDRALGKAPQTVHNVGYVGDPKDIQRVDAELASMLSDRALMQSLQPECPEPSLS